MQNVEHEKKIYIKKILLKDLNFCWRSENNFVGLSK